LAGVARRILLLDDDIAQIAAVKRVLLKEGYQPLLATNGSDLRAQLAKARPELLLVATDCEGQEGLLVARELSSAEETCDIPIVLIGEGEVAGAVASLAKPIEAAALVEAVTDALSRPPPGGTSEPPVERRSAADALRARAEELRRSRPTLVPAPEPAPQKAPPPAPIALSQRRPAPPGPVAPLEPPPASVAAARAPAPASLLGPDPARPASPAPAREALREGAPAKSSPATGWFEGDAVEEPAPAPLQVEDFAEADEERKVARESGRAVEVQVPEHLAPVPAGPRAAAEEEAARELRKAALAAAQAALADDLRSEAEAELRRRTAAESARATRAEALAEAEARRAAEAEAEKEAAAAEAARRRELLAARQRQVLAAPRPSEAEELKLEPPPPELLAGTLATTSAARLLAHAARSRARGLLEVGGPDGRMIWFEGGRVVGARSGLPGEHCEDVALRLGLIGREPHRAVARAAAGLPSRRVGVLLLERGLLKPTELVLLARSAAKEVVFATFSAEGRYRFLPGEGVPSEERVAIDRSTLALAVDGVRRRWTRARLDAVLGGACTLLAPAPGAPPPAELALSAEEARLARLADGLRTLDEVLSESPLDPLSSRQALAALVEVGALDLKAREPLEAPSAAPSAIDLARVDERLELVHRADYFAILGLGRACTPYEIRQAAERLLLEVADERFRPQAGDGLAAKLCEIRQVVEEARDILSDDALRAEYVAALGGEAGDPSPRVAAERGTR